MESLEKYMLFIPNRFYAKGNELYVSFNIAGIPSDMRCVSMTLHVPLSVNDKDALLTAHEVVAAWDEQSVRSAPPAVSSTVRKVRVEGKRMEGQIKLEDLAGAWREHSFHNHGIYVRAETSAALFSGEKPPYLLMATD